MEVCLARGTLILPLWKSSFFWNVCTTDGVHWGRFVIDWVYLPKFQGLFVKGKARNSLFGTRSFDFDLVALRIDFRRPWPPLCRQGFCTLPNGKCDSCNQTLLQLSFLRLSVDCLLCFLVGFCQVPPWYHTFYVIKDSFVCYIFICPFIPVISPVCCLFAFVSVIGFSQYFSPFFLFCIFQMSSNQVFGTLIKTLYQSVPYKGQLRD